MQVEKHPSTDPSFQRPTPHALDRAAHDGKRRVLQAFRSGRAWLGAKTHKKWCNCWADRSEESGYKRSLALKRRIESSTSRTAVMTCISRACSAMEANPNYRSDDYIAPLLVPSGLRPFLNISLARRLFTKVVAPKGRYQSTPKG